MRRELTGALAAFAIVVCGALALAAFDIGFPGQPLLETLRFHLAAALLAIIVLLLVNRAWIVALVFVVPLGASLWDSSQIVYRQHLARVAATPEAAQPLFRMISFNLLNTNENGRQIVDYLMAADADVVALMEARPVGEFEAELASKYPYRSACAEQGPCDTVLLSKTPLSSVQVRGLGTVWANRLIAAQTEIGGKAVNVVVAHLVKPYFDQFAIEEVGRLRRIMERIEGPLVVAGDFNAAAWSDNIARLIDRAGLAPGPSYPATWPVELGPLGVPIDNILTRAPLVIQSIEAIPDPMGSNHRGLIAELGLVGN